MTNALHLPCEIGKVSDGYHTFDELYEHRCLLFMSLMKAHPEISWISNMHDDGSSLDGWFIAGMSLPTGQITYHIPEKLWSLANKTRCKVQKYAPKWDGHTSVDVAFRLSEWIKLFSP